MEFLAALGHVNHKLTRRELRSILLGEAVHHANVVIHADGVEVAERSSTERSESGSEDEANVANDGVGNDLVLQAHNGLVDEAGDNTVLDLLLLESEIFLDELLSVSLDLIGDSLLLGVLLVVPVVVN